MIELSEKNGAVNRGFGGDTLNTSVYIARQTDASALSVHYVTARTDAFSQQMLDSWQQENVNTDLIQRMADRLPGLYYIETDDTGERTFYYWRNEAAAKFWLESDRAAAICEELATFDYLYRMADRLPGLYYIETDDTGERTYYWRNEAAASSGWSDRAAAICEELATFDYLYLSGISLAILSPASRDKLFTLLRECRANGGKVIFDNNYRPRLWPAGETQQVYQEMLACTDIAFLTLDDEDALWGENRLLR